MNEKIKVVIADDEVVTLSGLVAMTESLGDELEVVGTAGNGADALSLCLLTGADLLLTDIRMPVMDGIELTKKIEEAHAPVTAIIVSAYDEREYLQHAIRSPIVFDYVMKPFHRSEFVDLINSAVAYIKTKKQVSPVESLSGLLLITDDVAALMRQGKGAEAVKLFGDTWERSVPRANYADFASAMLMRLGWSARPSEDPKSAVFQLYATLKSLGCCEDFNSAGAFIERYVLKNSENFSSQSRVTALISSCLRILDERFSEKYFGISEAAEALGVTPNYLSSRFSRDMGISFTKHLTLLRIEKAKDYLADSTLKIYQIAGMVGFEDSGYFDRVFKDIVGLKPSEYREKTLAVR